MERILQHWNIPITTLPLFLDNADGSAVLAVLANAGAKDWPDRRGDSTLYALKAELVQRACVLAGTGHSWRDEHDGMPIYFVQTNILLDDQPLQIAFHFLAGDTLPNLPNWPNANGRRWSRQQAQPRAREIALSYLARRGVLLVGEEIAQ